MTVAYDRLRQLARNLLRGFPVLRAWEETDDVWQSAAVRFDKALKSRPPGTVVEFFSLAARQIRWQLLDFARTYSGAPLPGSMVRPSNESTLGRGDPGRRPTILSARNGGLNCIGKSRACPRNCARHSTCYICVA